MYLSEVRNISYLSKQEPAPNYFIALTGIVSHNFPINRRFAAMNYLAHAFLSFGDGDILTGNMIADHVKGKVALDQYPGGIKKGIILHRKIDEQVDIHPATARAKVLFRAEYGLYAGPIMDILYDHFLAGDPKFFKNAATLHSFSLKCYNELEKNAVYFPPKFAAYFPYMREHNWLYNYRTLKGMERSLRGLERKAAHMPPADKAYEIFVSNYYHLNQCYYELIDDIISFVTNEKESTTDRLQ